MVLYISMCMCVCVYTHCEMIQFSSVGQSFLTLCDPMDCCTPGLPVHHQIPEFIQTHVHRVSDAIQPSHPLSSPSPPAFNLSQHQDLCQWVDLCPIQYCSLRHWTLLPSPVTSTTGCCFCFGSVSSFFLQLFHHWSPAAYWAPTDLGRSSFSVPSFCLFILFMGFSRQEYWSGLPLVK